MNLTLGFSPCPNDTFIFHALVEAIVQLPGVDFDVRMEDVETLNQLALRGELDVTKVSYGAVPHLLDRYTLLRSGGALGRGCGPLLVAREERPIESLRRIAIPGRLTTAYLLLRLFAPGLPEPEERLYSDIMPAVERGDVDAGLIIHESRFTYRDHGLVQLVDLGEWWERETGSPIPLGGIVARTALGAELVAGIDAAIRRSVEHAFAHPADSDSFVRANAQEMDPSVMRRHIDLYVNDFSIDLGEEGEKAVTAMMNVPSVIPANAGIQRPSEPARAPGIRP